MSLVRRRLQITSDERRRFHGRGDHLYLILGSCICPACQGSSGEGRHYYRDDNRVREYIADVPDLNMVLIGVFQAVSGDVEWRPVSPLRFAAD